MHDHRYGKRSSGVTEAMRRESRAQQFARQNMHMIITTYDGLVLSGTAHYQEMPYSASQVVALVALIRREYEESGKTNTAPLYNTLAIAGVNVCIGSIEKVERG